MSPIPEGYRSLGKEWPSSGRCLVWNGAQVLEAIYEDGLVHYNGEGADPGALIAFGMVFVERVPVKASSTVRAKPTVDDCPNRHTWAPFSGLYFEIKNFNDCEWLITVERIEQSDLPAEDQSKNQSKQ